MRDTDPDQAERDPDPLAVVRERLGDGQGWNGLGEHALWVDQVRDADETGTWRPAVLVTMPGAGWAVSFDPDELRAWAAQLESAADTLAGW